MTGVGEDRGEGGASPASQRWHAETVNEAAPHYGIMREGELKPLAFVYDPDDARLIASAPSLLAAALLAAPHGETLIHGPNVSISAAAYQALCAAIAKATGAP